MRSKKSWRILALLLAFAVATGLFVVSPAGAGASGNRDKPTVVLVHGAFADSSGWNEVVGKLQRDGYPVIASANPLRGVASDSAYLDNVLRSINGPIILVGHSYGGVVITNAAVGNPQVKALVYVAAFAPDQGETVEVLAGKFPGSQLGPAALDLRKYTLPDGTLSADGYIKASVFHKVFAGDLPASTAAIMAATQRPADAHTLQQASGEPAWRTIPAWTLVARNDNVIPAATQRFMANRAGSKVVEVSSSHVAMMSRPRAVADLIDDAARATVR